MWHSKSVKNSEWLSRMWAFRCCLRLNNFPQYLQENFSAPIWTSAMCLIKWSSLLNVFLQFPHWKDFVGSSRVTGFLRPFKSTWWWTFLWCLFIFFLAILLPHLSHFGFFSMFISVLLFLCSRYFLYELNFNLHRSQVIFLFSPCFTDLW